MSADLFVDLSDVDPLHEGADPLHNGAETTGDNAGHDTMDQSVEPDLDALIEQASLPNLAALIRQGLSAGRIKPQHQYK